MPRMRWLLLPLGLLVLACGPLAPTPDEEPDDDEPVSLLRSTFEGEKKESTEVAPDYPDPPPESEPRREEAKPPASEDNSPECKKAKARREKQEKRIYNKRVSVNAIDERQNTVKSAMSGCVNSVECATDGERVMDLQKNIASAEAAYEAALAQVGVLEADLYEIDKEIKRACGRPSH